MSTIINSQNGSQMLSHQDGYVVASLGSSILIKDSFGSTFGSLKMMKDCKVQNVSFIPLCHPSECSPICVLDDSGDLNIYQCSKEYDQEINLISKLGDNLRKRGLWSHDDNVNAFCWKNMPGNMLLCAVAFSNSCLILRFGNFEEPELVCQYKQDNTIQFLVWAPFRPQLIVSDGREVTFCDLDLENNSVTKGEGYSFFEAVHDMQWSPNGNCLAVATFVGKVYLFSEDNWRELKICEDALTATTWISNDLFVCATVCGDVVTVDVTKCKVLNKTSIQGSINGIVPAFGFRKVLALFSIRNCDIPLRKYNTSLRSLSTIQQLDLSPTESLNLDSIVRDLFLEMVISCTQTYSACGAVAQVASSLCDIVDSSVFQHCDAQSVWDSAIGMLKTSEGSETILWLQALCQFLQHGSNLPDDLQNYVFPIRSVIMFLWLKHLICNNDCVEARNVFGKVFSMTPCSNGSNTSVSEVFSTIGLGDSFKEQIDYISDLYDVSIKSNAEEVGSCEICQAASPFPARECIHLHPLQWCPISLTLCKEDFGSETCILAICPCCSCSFMTHTMSSPERDNWNAYYKFISAPSSSKLGCLFCGSHLHLPSSLPNPSGSTLHTNLL